MNIALGHGKVALVDECDYARVCQFHWHAFFNNRKWYVAKKDALGRSEYLHRFILNAKPGEIVDHKNGDTFDCRRNNLRICNRFENSQNAPRHRNNKSGYKGVHWNSKLGKWKVEITARRKRVYVGIFDLLDDAVSAYDEAARKHHRDFAKLNRTE